MTVLGDVGASQILCPLAGVRLSTILALSAFVALAITRSERKPLLACLAWLGGFEVAYQVTLLATGGKLVLGIFAPIFEIVVGAAVVAWAMRRDVSVWWPPFVLVALLWIVWVATGFHSNFHPTTAHFDPLAEALNEGAKTAWAVAYFFPLVRARGISR